MEWNRESDEPSELYKCTADFFVYGYFNRKEQNFLEVYVLTFSKLKLLLRHPENFTPGLNDKNQTFVAVPFSVILKHPDGYFKTS